jgi:hypothetical protein
VFVEIETNNIIPAMPFVVQPVTKPVSPLRGGTSLEIIPLHVQTFTISVPLIAIVSQPMEGSEKSNKK